MITLPDFAQGRVGTPVYMDKGALMDSELGGESQRINRPGDRFGIMVELAPLRPREANIVINRLIRAKQEGLRMAYPLTEQHQGLPGTTRVNGAVTSATKSLSVKNATPNYLCKEGFWLSIERSNGRHYLHTVDANTIANASGVLALTVSPAMRFAFADNDRVHLSVPMIEGFVRGSAVKWRIDAENFMPLSFEIWEK